MTIFAGSKGFIDFDQKNLASEWELKAVLGTCTIAYFVAFQLRQFPSHSTLSFGSKLFLSWLLHPSSLLTVLLALLPVKVQTSARLAIKSNKPPEYRNKILTKLAGGNSRNACYGLAVTIFSLGIFRDFLYERALRSQPSHPLLETALANYAAYTLLACGNVLVLSSMWALGVIGTYLGDYFGFLMDEMVTGFPFNICSAPMYYGSTMSFLGTAILFGKPAGILLTIEVFAVYLIALRFEDPFTAGIYAKRAEKQKKVGKKAL
jgi:phosphatidylethanolamine N-methyltransferase